MFAVAALETVKGFPVCLAGSVEFSAHIVKLFIKGIKAIQQSCGGIQDFLLVAFLIGARPGDLDQLQERHQVDGADDHDLAFERPAPESGIPNHGQLVRRLVGDEHDDKIDCLVIPLPDIGGVVLPDQFLDVGADTAGMPGKRILPFAVRFRVHVVGIGAQTDLAVDDDILAVGIMHDHIRAHHAFFLVLQEVAVIIPQGFLTLVMNAFFQSRADKNLLQNHLTPAALRLVVSLQGGSQIVRVGSDLLRRRHQMRNLLLEFGVQRNPLFPCLIDGGLEIAEFLLERFQERGKLFPVEIGKMTGFFLENLRGKSLELLLEQIDLRLPVLFHFLLVFTKLLFQNGKRFFQSVALGGKGAFQCADTFLACLQLCRKFLPEVCTKGVNLLCMSLAQRLKFPFPGRFQELPFMSGLFFQRFQSGGSFCRGNPDGVRLRVQRLGRGKTLLQSVPFRFTCGDFRAQSQKSDNATAQKAGQQAKNFHDLPPEMKLHSRYSRL